MTRIDSRDEGVRDHGEIQVIPGSRSPFPIANTARSCNRVRTPFETMLLRSVFTIAVLAVAAECTLFVSLANARPNVLFIAIDDLNDWIGCLDGHPQVKTPNIDRLAERGTLFSNAHCQAPLCNSSRTSLLTGLRPSTTGIHGLAPWFRRVEGLENRVTIPQHFAANGYSTFSTGKIFHGGYGRGKGDHEFHKLGPAAGVGARPDKKLIPPTPGGNHPLMDWGTFPHRDEDKGDWQVASWAVEQLDAGIDEPFFLSVGFFLPHVPCFATQEWFDLYPEDTLELPRVLATDREDTPMFSWFLNWDLPEPRLSWCVETDTWNPLVRSYLACISFVDSQVGRVLDALERSGKADDTIVVLWSDHGYHLRRERDHRQEHIVGTLDARSPDLRRTEALQREPSAINRSNCSTSSRR